MDITKHGEMARNGAVRIISNQNQIKSNQIKTKQKINQIKSKSNQNKKSNLKQDFKLKPVSNAFSSYLRVCLIWGCNC